MNYENRTFLVTGGSSGLGGATASMLVENGANVVILDINEETGKAKEAELGAKSRFIKTDVTSESDVLAAIELAKTAFSGVHGVINAAGIAVVAKVLDRDGNPHALDLFAKGIQVNLVGTFNVIRLAAAEMAKNEPTADGERGVIINTASVAAFDGQIGQACYSASKSGVVGMALPIARELARFGIRICTIAPGIFETPMLAGLPEEARDSLGKIVPFPPRLGKPAEFASLAGHIIENVVLNGEVIRLDGAIRLTAK
ncbi:MAG: 3-hydroxyacyl-CoA dehydrogenase [Gammaproteobacteria bacterium]|nr:MAG: 3-hydroxyacyl-CoA dehydrogenase [Gammaproteobacteria bacterium]RLA21806.1 MAG: 3-hydroxyacyl-CoA dehydrogenase [Gammaproteobacteria bacterium]